MPHIQISLRSVFLSCSFTEQMLPYSLASFFFSYAPLLDFGWTDPLAAWVLQDLEWVSTPVHVVMQKLFFFFFFFRSVCVEMLHRLHLDNFNSHTLAHTNMSWHTYWLLCTKWAYARWNAHAELLWTFPSNVYASATIKTRETAMWDHLKSPSASVRG